jgi:hypothetical protein
MLKLLCHSFIASILLVTTTAVSATTLLIKSSSPGYVMQELALYTTCTLDDKGLVVIKNQLNGLTSKKTTILQVSFKAIKDLIAEASMGKIIRPDALIDMQSTTYYAYQKQRYGKIKKVFLWEDYGVPEVNAYNETPSALTLRTFMDTICN